MNIIPILLLLVGSSPHDIQVAYYKLYLGGDAPRIEYVLELKDVAKSLNVASDDLSEHALHHYLDLNFLIDINGKTAQISNDQMTIKNKHIYVEGNILSRAKVINTVVINNTCLLNIDGHSNVVEIHVADTQRDFLMNNERTSITINY